MSAVRHPGLIWLVAIAAALAGALAPPPWWQLGIIAVAFLVCAVAGRIRTPALTFGLVAALVFVALRLAYRIIFGSLIAPPADAILLLDLPLIPLGGPFRGIALFGPLTLDALLATLSDATRFTVVFVVFGAANALADARSLLARAPRAMLPLATVLALALGAVPALIASIQRVDRAARMRGEGRTARLLVPVLEQAVERATTLGASMELRGFGAERRSVSVEPYGDAAEVLVSADELTVARGKPGATPPATVLDRVHLELRAGELTFITGPTGSGKSTLMQALAGLIPAYAPGRVSGVLEITGVQLPDALDELRPAMLAGTLALVPQRVEHSFVAETVRGELAFAPSRLGAAGLSIDELVDHALTRFHLTHLADRDPASLSAGEATRTALAAAVLARPRVLLLDEPIADLDPASVAIVTEVLRELLAEGCAVLVAEHRPQALGELEGVAMTRHCELRGGRLEPVAGEVAVPVRASAVPPRAFAVQGREPIALAREHIVERGGRALLRVPMLALRPGEVGVLSGPNGSGKTSLLEDIALPGKRGRADGVALVPHRVDDLLIRDTIDAECRFADRRAGAAAGTTARVFRELIGDSVPAELQPALPRLHPRDASAGTRLALGIAVQLAHAPRVLLLDEPTRGLDRAARERLARVVAGLASEGAAGQGAAVLLSSHDHAFTELLRAAGARVRLLEVVGRAAGGPDTPLPDARQPDARQPDARQPDAPQLDLPQVVMT